MFKYFHKGFQYFFGGTSQKKHPVEEEAGRWARAMALAPGRSWASWPSWPLAMWCMGPGGPLARWIIGPGGQWRQWFHPSSQGAS